MRRSLGPGAAVGRGGSGWQSRHLAAPDICRQAAAVPVGEDKGPTGLTMKGVPSLAEFPKEHVGTELECIDRMHPNAEVPRSRLEQTESIVLVSVSLVKVRVRRSKRSGAGDRCASYRHDLAILHAEFLPAQIRDRAANGRRFFREMIRENIDLGRPRPIQEPARKATACQGR